MKKEVLSKLAMVRKAVEHVAYISYFIVITLFALMFSSIIILAFALSKENLLLVTDKIDLVVDKFALYLFGFVVAVGIYGLGKLIIENILEDRKKK